MKTITIRELHARTGQWLRAVDRHGQILVTNHGRIIARIVPESEPAEVPYFARRRFINAKTRELIESGQLGRGGSDVTQLISEDREDRLCR